MTNNVNGRGVDKIYNRYIIWSVRTLLGVKIVQLVDRTDLFKISNFVCGAKGTVTRLHSSVER
jgi:hypothetical protein